MKHYIKSIVLVLSIAFFSNLGIGQNEIKIKFIGNCGLYMSDGSSDLYIDFPYKSGAYGYMKYDIKELDSVPDNAIFLFTHRHADHYSKKALKAIRDKHKDRVFGSWNTKQFDNLNSAIGDFKIETFKTKHRFAIKHYSYLITWHGKKIYLSGDTESAETIAVVQKIDWAFVPYWILLDASDKKLKIDAAKIGVYHLYPNQKLNNSSPEKIILLDKQGMKISIPY